MNSEQNSTEQPEGAISPKPRAEWDEDERFDGRPKTPTIQVLVVLPDEAPRLQTIPNTLEAMQGIVGGLITTFPTGIEGTIGICNDEGLILQMPPNRHVPAAQTVIFGPFFVAGDGVNFHSLTPLQLEQALDLFAPTLTIAEFLRVLRQHDEAEEWMANWD